LILPIVFSIVSFFSSVSVFAQDENLNKPKPKVMVVIYSTEVSSSFLGVAMEGNRNTENQIDNAIGVLGRDKIMGFVFNDQPNMPEYEW